MIEYIDHMGDDMRVANSARVSFNKWKEDFDVGDARLIYYLATHNHFTPFTHCQITLRISMPIFLARQAFKHQIGVSRNEVSRRYVNSEPEFYQPVWRKKPDKNIKQGSGEEIEDQKSCTGVYRILMDTCKNTYNKFVKMGVAPEQARALLPQSMMTSWIETGSLYYYARLYHLRKDPHAQKEWEEYVAKLDEILSEKFPISWKALKEDKV